MIFEDPKSQNADEQCDVLQLPSNIRTKRWGNLIDIITTTALIALSFFIYITEIEETLFTVIILFPIVWTPLRMLPVLKFLSNRRLREDLALAPVDASIFLSSHIKRSLYRALIVPIIILIEVFLVGMLLEHNYGVEIGRISILATIFLSVLFTNEVLIALVIMSIIFLKIIHRQSPELSVPSMAAMVGLPITSLILILFSAAFGYYMLPLIMIGFAAAPIFLFMWLASLWETIRRDYLKME